MGTQSRCAAVTTNGNFKLFEEALAQEEHEGATAISLLQTKMMVAKLKKNTQDKYIPSKQQESEGSEGNDTGMRIRRLRLKKNTQDKRVPSKQQESEGSERTDTGTRFKRRKRRINTSLLNSKTKPKVKKKCQKKRKK